MKPKNKEDKRNKKFLGAIIGGALGLAGGLISSKMSSDASKNAADKQAALQEELWRRNQTNQNKKDTLEQARNLTNVYSNQEYVDEYKNKVSFKNGGKMNDRVGLAKKLKCGGRRKAEGGGGFDWGSVINGAVSAATSIGSSYLAADAMNYATDKQKNYFVESSDNGIDTRNNAKRRLKKPSYFVTDDNTFDDRLRQSSLFRCGGRSKRK